MAAYRRVYMTHVTCRLTAKSRDQLRNATLGNRVWATFTFLDARQSLRKNEETRLDAFEMKGLRKILRVSWTARKTNEWVLNKAEIKRELLDTVKARKLAYYGHNMRKQGSCLKKEIMQGKCQVHAGEEDHARPGWTTSRRGQDSPWKSQSE